MSADQTEAIKEAIQVVVTWSQLASVLEAIIGFKPKETFKTSAVGAGLCFRNQPRVEALKEHVRCSRMMIAMSPIAFDGILHKMNGITSSYELCDVLILVISRFAEMMGKMAELHPTSLPVFLFLFPFLFLSPFLPLPLLLPQQ